MKSTTGETANEIKKQNDIENRKTQEIDQRLKAARKELDDRWKSLTTTKW